jgi:amidase
VSAREVADAALQRLDSVNLRITAIVDCRPDLVREQADRVDSLLARGNDPGPLAGVPVTVKINIDQAGFATTEGSRLYENRIAKFNSPAVDNMVGVQIVAGRYREDLCLRAGEAIEARGTPPAPIDPSN